MLLWKCFYSKDYSKFELCLLFRANYPKIGFKKWILFLGFIYPSTVGCSVVSSISFLAIIFLIINPIPVVIIIKLHSPPIYGNFCNIHTHNATTISKHISSTLLFLTASILSFNIPVIEIENTAELIYIIIVIMNHAIMLIGIPITVNSNIIDIINDMNIIAQVTNPTANAIIDFCFTSFVIASVNLGDNSFSTKYITNA